MRSVPTLLVLLGLALSLLPPVTCLGFGRECGCCLPGDAEAGAPAGTPAMAKGCPCQGPEVRRCGEDGIPRTQALERVELVISEFSVPLPVSAPAPERALQGTPSACPHLALAVPLRTLHCILLI